MESLAPGQSTVLFHKNAVPVALNLETGPASLRAGDLAWSTVAFLHCPGLAGLC